ncbi:hypothetical protein LTR78_009144 [Recurvomyces mirabilis]|uniref:Uncharacterized protein n=1 Tax=Recurvomyces mirabilis TaxID=574656 RepID=A0AAE0TU14_9PEZI|nr:hypothetical protein LTR78_009144 [Recurvomyces mirabilis]KAK5161080.1 hypothetical protein LTS14_000876 [Recurvomyces mirabilis]
MAAVASATSGHIRKRQYQPSITSFFNHGDRTSSRPSRSPMSPPLPPETQASLISVGMRVRKSVPEGYKTHKPIGTDGFPFPSTAPAAPVQNTRPGYNQEPSRELMPFCGLHRVGGMAMQPQSYAPPSSAPPATRRGYNQDEDSIPGLSMSQQTLPSTQGSYMSAVAATVLVPSKKRTFDEEMEEDMDALFDDMEAADSSTTIRLIAKSKSSLRRAATNSMLGSEHGNDFEEAGFLAPMDVDN